MDAAKRIIGVSLKAYLDVGETSSWAKAVAGIAEVHPAVVSGATSLFVMPSLPALTSAASALGAAPVALGAQDLFWEDRGPYTGAVSGTDLAALGCRYVEIGHSERRRFFGEDDRTIRLKFAAAIRNGLIPVLCVGERVRSTPIDAARACIDQIDNVLEADDQLSQLVVAYEPEWAIGQPTPAPVGHVVEAASRIRAALQASAGVHEFSLIYGGSAGPGLLSQLGQSVDGLFLGRFAHDPDALLDILDESASIPPSHTGER